MSALEEVRYAKYLSGGLALVSLFVFTVKVSDPVNAPKFLLLGLVSFGAFGALFFPEARRLWREQRILIMTTIATIFFMVLTVMNSDSPITQNMYGVQGRNTGFLNHIALFALVISILAMKSMKSLHVLFLGLLLAGLGNLLYCLWVLAFGDFVAWNNPYKSLLGTFGNPNFASSFLAISATGFLGMYITKNFSLRKALISLVLISITILEIRQTHSTQGLIVLIAGCYIIVWLSLYLSHAKLSLIYGWSFAGAVVAALGLLGITNTGPLANLLFQETLAFRKEYWLAGIKMGLQNPIFGVGLDSYGDWYRQSRSAESLISPGINVVTNVSHNIYIDAFANGGFPMLFGYLIFAFFTLQSIFKTLKSMVVLDPLFIGIATAWFCFQLQSLISINQIGISIWGWALSGMLISYNSIVKKNERPDIKLPKEKVKSSQTIKTLRPLILLFSFLLAFVLYAPPVLADHKWTLAYSKLDSKMLLKSLESSYFSPSTTAKYLQSINIFEGSKLHREAHFLALRATAFNPKSFESWQFLYNNTLSSESEKQTALNNMLELDPMNPAIESLIR